MADWKGVNISDHDMLRMQQEALRRVRQMQQRSAQSVHSSNVQYAEGPTRAYEAPSPAPVTPPRPAPQASEPPSAGANHTSAPHYQHRPIQPEPHASPHEQHAANTGGTPSLSGLLSQLGGGLGGITERLGLSGIAGRLGLGGGERAEGGSNILSSFLGEDSAIGKVLDALSIDNERLLLIGLLLVLMNEKADRTLLIALFYLIF